MIEDDGDQVTGFIEKPTMRYRASMGIYIYESRALGHIPEGYFDFPYVVRSLLKAGEWVCAYPLDGTWFDIGTISEYEAAQRELDENPGLFDRA
ncbi:MAG: nucleotidyltransferase family protein [Solirubrobacterales bacterium]